MWTEFSLLNRGVVNMWARLISSKIYSFVFIEASNVKIISNNRRHSQVLLKRHMFFRFTIQHMSHR
jgi:hypothetical protein